MKQFTQSGIEFEVLTGPEERKDGKLGRVFVKSNVATGAHGYTSRWVQLNKNSKGYYITLNKERVYIELPAGQWYAEKIWYIPKHFGAAQGYFTEGDTRRWIPEGEEVPEHPEHGPATAEAAAKEQSAGMTERQTEIIVQMLVEKMENLEYQQSVTGFLQTERIDELKGALQAFKGLVG